MAGAGAQLGLTVFIVLGAVGIFDVRHLVQQIAAVKAQAHAAHQVIGFEIAHAGDDHKLARARFVIRLALVIQPGGYGQGGKELAILKDIQRLGQFVNDHAIIGTHIIGFQLVGADIAGYKGVPGLDLGIMEGAGIRFHQRPAVAAGFQHMHGLGRARYHAHTLAAVAGLGAQDNLLLLPHIHHLNGRGQHGPHSGLVGNIHGRAPVAARMLRMIAAQMRGRDAGALIGKGRRGRGGRRGHGGRRGRSRRRLRALRSLADGQHGGIHLPLIGKDQAIRALGQRLGKELPVQRQHMQPAQQHALGQDDSHIRAALRGQAQRCAPTGRQKVAQLHALAGQQGAVLHIGQALRQRKAGH